MLLFIVPYLCALSVYWFPVAAVTNCLKLGWFMKITLLLQLWRPGSLSQELPLPEKNIGFFRLFVCFLLYMIWEKALNSLQFG